MGIPRAVQEMEDNADKLISEQKQPKQEEIRLEIAPEVINEEPNADLPDEFKKDEPAKIIKQAPDVQPLTEAERMYKKVDNENKTLKIKLGEQGREMAELKAMVESLSKPKEQPKPEVKGFSQDEVKLFEEEGLSPEIIKIIESRTTPQNTVSPEVEKLRNEFNTVREVTANTSADLFDAKLDTMCPGWREKNVNDSFLDGLNELAPYSTKSKLQVLQEAYNAQDSNVVAQIFNEFQIGEEQAPPKKDLADLAEPKSSAAPPPKAKGEMWGAGQIKSFYDEIRRYPEKYTDKQVAAIERAYIPGHQ